MRAIDGGGPILTRPKVVLSFRGAGWAATQFSPADAQQAFEAALASPYMSHLIQYRGIRRAEIVFTVPPDLTSIGRLGPDPRKFVPTVWVISDEDIRAAVLAAVVARPPQAGEDLLYIVAVSQDPVSVAATEQNANGFHGKMALGALGIFYGVLLNQSALDAESQWRYLPGVFTHELVEASTDPDTRSGFVLDDGPQPDKEICDLGITREVILPGLAHPVELAAYWSELEGAAVVPTSYSLRIALNLTLEAPLPSVRSVVAGPSVRTVVLAGCNP